MRYSKWKHLEWHYNHCPPGNKPKLKDIHMLLKVENWEVSKGGTWSDTIIKQATPPTPRKLFQSERISPTCQQTLNLVLGPGKVPGPVKLKIQYWLAEIQTERPGVTLKSKRPSPLHQNTFKAENWEVYLNYQLNYHHHHYSYIKIKSCQVISKVIHIILHWCFMFLCWSIDA